MVGQVNEPTLLECRHDLLCGALFLGCRLGVEKLGEVNDRDAEGLVQARRARG